MSLWEEVVGGEGEREGGKLNEIQWGLWALVEFRKLHRIVMPKALKTKAWAALFCVWFNCKNKKQKQVNNLTSNAQQLRLIQRRRRPSTIKELLPRWGGAEWIPKNKTLSSSFLHFFPLPHQVRRTRQSLLHISCPCWNGLNTPRPHASNFIQTLVRFLSCLLRWSSVIRGSGNFLWIAILPCSTAFHVIGLDISPNLQIHLPWPTKRNLKLVFLLSPAKNKFRDSSMAPLSYSSSYFAPLLFSGCCSDWGIFWHWRTTCIVLVQFLDCVTLHSLASVYVIS